MSGELWPYLIVLVAGFLPNEAFRLAGVLLSRGIDEKSELFAWVRAVATTLLAAVVSRLIYAPGAALETVPMAIRVASVAAGVASFVAFKRSLLAGVLAGEAFLVAAAWWFTAR